MAKRIKRWVQSKFGGGEYKLFLELGAHRGQDTAWLADLPGVVIHAFEPDPRCVLPPLANVIWHRKAIAAHDGRCELILSERDVGPGIETGSSSIRKPTGHLIFHPTTRFIGSVEVECTTLDTFIKQEGIERINFIWADIQGAEVDMIDGGRMALSRTSFLFTEYYNVPMYEGQVSLNTLCGRLSQFRLMRRWHKDALLANMELVSKREAEWALA